MDATLAVKHICTEMIQKLLNPKDIARSFLLGISSMIYSSVKVGNYWYMAFIYFYDYPFYVTWRITWNHCWFCYVLVLIYPRNITTLVSLVVHILSDTRDHILNLSEDRKLTAYALSEKFNQQKCIICLKTFDVDKCELLLICGHRYHTKCLNQWEFYSTQMGVHHIKCAMCDRPYSKYTKWNYIFDPNALYHEH